jgi:hypothetical protein
LFPVSEDPVSRSMKFKFYQFIYEVAMNTLLGFPEFDQRPK